jgi:hypothetical protein
MKISGGPRSEQPTTEGVGEASDVERASGKDFLGKLDKTAAASGPTPAKPPEADKPKSFVGDIGERLESGELTPQQAVDEVLERVLDKQLGAEASPQLRSEVASRVRNDMENDAFLKGKIDSLG